MPIVTVELLEGTVTPEQKQKIATDVTQVLVDSSVLVERIVVIIKENPKGNWAVGSVFQTEENKPPVFVSFEEIEELFLEKQKKRFVNVVSKTFADLGFPPERTVIILRDNSWKDWAVGGVLQVEFADHIPPLT